MRELTTFIGMAGALVIVESVGTASLTYWAKTGSLIAYIFGLYMFVVLATLLGWAIRLSGHMNSVNIVWQSASIVSLFAVSAYMFKEPVTMLHLLGVALAIGAGLCYTI